MDIPLNTEYMAPNGQIYLQNGRYIIMDKIMVIINILTFHAYKNPMASLKASFESTSGTPPSSVPAGQMYLQKVGSP